MNPLRAILLFPLLALTGCATLLMSTNDRTPGQADLKLTPGTQVSVTVKLSDQIQRSEPERSVELVNIFSRTMEGTLVRQGFRVSPDAPHRLQLDITEFDRGSGFLRGLGSFLPLFGAGASKLGGLATLTVDGRKRVLEVRKTGNATGWTYAGDRTAENAQWFADAVMGEISG